MPCAADWTAMSLHRQILEPRGERDHMSAILVEGPHWERASHRRAEEADSPVAIARVTARSGE